MTRLLARLRAWLRRDPHGPLYLSGPGVDDAAGGWWMPRADEQDGVVIGDQPFVPPDHDDRR